MSERKSIHDGWTPQPHEQEQEGNPMAEAPKMPRAIWAYENPDRSYSGEKIFPHYHAYPEAAYSLGRHQAYVRADLSDSLAGELLECSKIFHQYGELHAAKNTPEGNEKAAANIVHAKRILTLLEAYHGKKLKECEVCEGTGRLGCLPDDNEHTHPCDTCQPEANKEFQRGVAFGEAVAKSE